MIKTPNAAVSKARNLPNDSWGDDYRHWLAALKQRVERARLRAVTSANRELVTLYWQIGREILDRQQRQGWGAGVVDQLARDLKAAFPDMRGFSPRNLKYMRSLAQAWPNAEFVQQPAAQLPWFHLCTLLDKVKDPVQRSGYAGKTLEHGWSRQVLTMQIETEAYTRTGSAVTIYLSAIDAQVKAPDDQPTIGLLLCKEKNRLVAEYALRGVAKPMGVAEYQLLRQVPESLETELPSIDQIEAELRADLPDH
jgi:predicted nuclease of restriction endonuclease-like (RecB) superfamily